MPYIPIDEIRDGLFYTDSGGRGRPIVLIHGWPLSHASWDAISHSLVEAGHRVITYDRRGFGQSFKPENGYDYDTFAADLNAVMTHLNLVDVCLVGFSMGGGEVARYIGRYGTGRVTGAVFIGAITPCLGIEHPDNAEGALSTDAVCQMQKEFAADREGFLQQFLTTFYSIDDSGQQRLMVDPEQIETSLRWAEPALSRALSESIATWASDFRSDVDKIAIPVLVIHGRADQIVPFEASGARMGRIPTASVVTIEDGPHGILSSHEQVVTTALLDFLS